MDEQIDSNDEGESPSLSWSTRFTNRLADMTDEKNLVTASEDLLGINPDVLNNLNSYDDFISFYIQIEETSSSFHWLKADVLLEISKKFGEKTLEALSSELHQPRGTISNYIRTAKAFPKDKRVLNASFTLHFQAAFADVYDAKKGFTGENRFDWIEKAADGGWSTRKLHDAILIAKRVLPAETMLCQYCGSEMGDIHDYILYKLGTKGEPEKFHLHDTCFKEIRALIKKF